MCLPAEILLVLRLGLAWGRLERGGGKLITLCSFKSLFISSYGHLALMPNASSIDNQAVVGNTGKSAIVGAL